MTPTALDREIAAVLAAGTCSGCGLCTHLGAGLRMGLDDAGFLRPAREAAGPDVPDAARVFRAACPGVRVDAARTPAAGDERGATRDPHLGPVLGVWRAWATDPEIRRAGSSGGVLTALAAFLASTGEVGDVRAVAAEPAAPRRTVDVRIQTREEALAAAGSRYAPASSVAAPGALAPGGAVVGKPCEATAVRAWSRTTGEPAPLLLSFFCAGTPSAHATDALLEHLGVARDAPLRTLRYRGDGWPGRFRAEPADGSPAVDASYEESWGTHLGPAVQWRCKICPDGVGEASDVTAGDLWRTDARGYPDFTDGDGASALLARTPRGLDLVRRAVAAGVIAVEPVTAREVAAVQPLQRTRRETLLGRLVGARLAGRRVPAVRGFGLVLLALRDPRRTVRTARGAFRRARAGRPARGDAR